MKKTLILAAMGAALVTQSCKKEEVIIEKEVTVYQTDTLQITKPVFLNTDKKPVTEDIRPALLKAGDKVAVCAPSNAINDAEIAEGISMLEQWGLTVVKAENLYKVDGRYAGTLEERRKGLQDAIDDPDIRAIFMARGGYGASQLLPLIDWQPMYASPKWIIGYSDISGLHISLNNMGFENILYPMMRVFTKDEESLNCLKDMLFGQPQTLEIPTNENCVRGNATGRLVGGNLSLLYSMSGTAYDLNTLNSILFLEDSGEANYSVDRMLLNLQQSGKLQQLKGIIIGDFIAGNQGGDLPLNEIILKYVGKLGIPVMYGLPCGHGNVNMSLRLGSQIKMTVDSNTAKLEFTNAAAK